MAQTDLMQSEEARPRAAPLALNGFLPYRLSVLANTVSGAIAQLYAERFDLTIPEWRVMAVLGAFAPLSAGEVAARAAMDKVSVSRAVARLMRRGRLDRQLDPADRRRSLLRLSAEGGRIHGEIAPLARSVEARLLAALEPGERRVLDALLDKLQRRAERL